MVAGKYDSKKLAKLIKKGHGTGMLKTVEGEELSFKMDGPNLVLTDSKGRHGDRFHRQRLPVKRCRARHRHRPDALVPQQLRPQVARGASSGRRRFFVAQMVGQTTTPPPAHRIPMPYTFSAEQWLPFPVEVVFAFFADPDNLPRLMPRWQRARIDQAQIAPPPPRPANAPIYPGKAAGAGTRMTLSFRAVPLLPLRLPWDALIAEFAWNDHFCDVIDGRGPFQSWRHCHRLQPQPDPRPDPRPLGSRSVTSGTLLTDSVEYTLPFGVLGRVAHAIAVRRQIDRIFRFRHRMTNQLLPAYAATLS